MRNRFLPMPKIERLVASFGEARLLVDLQGRHELQGGTPEDQAQARAWIARFMPELVWQRSRRCPVLTDAHPLP